MPRDRSQHLVLQRRAESYVWDDLEDGEVVLETAFAHLAGYGALAITDRRVVFLSVNLYGRPCREMSIPRTKIEGWRLVARERPIARIDLDLDVEGEGLFVFHDIAPDSVSRLEIALLTTPVASGRDAEFDFPAYGLWMIRPLIAVSVVSVVVLVTTGHRAIGLVGVLVSSILNILIVAGNPDRRRVVHHGDR